MADQLDPQQIDALTQAINNLNETLGGKAATVQAHDIKNFDDLGKTLKGSLTDLNNFKKGVTVASKALGTMADGVDGVSRFSDSIESAADTVATLGAVIGTIVGGPLGLLVAGLGAGALAVAKYNKAVAKQADDLYKSYQDISRAGVVGAQGVDDIFKNMQKFGYGVEELAKMGELLKENSEILSQFGGTAIEGTKTLANMSKGISDAGLSEKFLNMGISIDQQNKGMAGYLKLQSQTGLAGKQTQEELAKSAAAYIEKQDLLTKITGQAAEKQQEQFERAASEERLGAKLRELERQGRKDEAQALREGYAQLAKFPKLQKGFADVSTGFIGSSKEAQQYLRTAPKSASELMKNNANVGKALDLLGGEAEKNTRSFDKLRMATGDPEAFASGSELAGVTSQLNKTQKERLELAKKEQDGAKAGINQTTRNLVENEKAQRQSRDDLQKARQAGARVVTGVGAGIAGAGAGVTGLPGKVAPGLQPERLQPGVATPGGSFDAVKKGVKEGVKEGTKELPPPTEAMKKAIQGSDLSKGLGAVAARFESGKGGAGTISSGAGDLGGKSYGMFQLAGRGGAKGNEVDQFLQESGFASAFKDLKVGTAEFDKKWKEVSSAMPEQFAAAQQEFTKKKMYDPQMEKLMKGGIDLSGKGRGVQEAVLSTANQYGAKTDVIQKALGGKDVSKLSDEQIINAIQDYKASTVGTRFRSSSESVQAGVSKRIEQERSALLGVTGPSGGYTPTAIAGVNPAAQLPQAPVAAAQPAPGSATDAQTTMLAQMLDKLDLIARSSAQQVATTKKMAAQQA